MRSLTTKLIGLLMLTSLTSIVLVAFSIQQVVRREFDDFILEQHRENFIDNVSAYYTANGSWANVDRTRPPQQGPREPQQPADPARFVLTDQAGMVVVGFDNFRRGDRVRQDRLADGEPVEVDGVVVGYVITTDRSLRRGPEEQAYLNTTTRALILAAIGTVIIVLMVGTFSARILTRPLRELTAAVQRIRGGELHQEVEVRSRDELGILARSMNEMSEALDRENRLRKQMTADIAHDLRSPLNVIAGYIESMRDGVLQPTAERLEILYDETQLLQRLIEDLRLLSLVDTGELKLNLAPVEINDLLRRFEQRYSDHASAKDITLQVEPNPAAIHVRVDEDRLWQVLANLLNNALRHSQAQSAIALSVHQDGQFALINIEDQGEGIAAEKLPHIFERFFRADEARSEGQTGLGLAIARSLVEAQEGQISVHSAAGKGTIFTIRLPVI